MLFNLEVDSGDRVLLYVVPDAYSEIPSVTVCGNGPNELVSIEANEIRDALVVAGRHETGRCGFRLDEELIPDIQSIGDLSVYEKSSGLLVYRRSAPDNIQKKLLRIETNLFPQLSFDKFMISRFQHGVQSIEKYGLESSTQLFLLGGLSSVYLSGRLLYTTYSYYIEGSFDSIIYLDDPYTALAERLLVISRMDGDRGALILGERDSMLFKSAIHFARELKFDNGKSLRRALRNLPQDVAVALVNPLTRQLTCTTPDEMPRRGAVASALDRLSSFAIVGLREEAGLYTAALGDMLGIDGSAIPLAKPLPSVVTLGTLLREEAQVENLIENDLEIYTHVHNAHQETLKESVE
jgi:hypothetical protein